MAGSRPLSELRTAEEADAMLAANPEAGGQGGEGDVHPDGVEQRTKSVSAGLSEAEELEKYIAIREEMYKKAKEFDSMIIGFETAIRRPYFHVRPLIGSELENWHNYLDFIERGGDFSKVCVISFWQLSQVLGLFMVCSFQLSCLLNIDFTVKSYLLHYMLYGKSVG